VAVRHEDCERFVDELLQLDDRDRPGRLYEMCNRAIAESEAVLPIVVGIILRDRDVYDWAEYTFQLALKVPHARGMALFESAVVSSRRGRVPEAIDRLTQLEAEHPLNAYQQRTFAHQLGRAGDFREASRRLQLAYELEPGSERECVALRQFFDYLQRFPYEEAVARCQALLSTFPLRSTREVADDVAAALREGRPYAMIRINDGEGSITHLSIDDEADFSSLYARARGGFHKLWFGDERRLYDPDWLEIEKEYNDVIPGCDCLGANVVEHLKVRYRTGDVQNVPSLFNIVRKLEQLRDTGRAEGITLTDPVIHHFLLLDGELERLLRSQSRIGLVSCHAGLPDLLRERFGLSEVMLHKTPGEAAITGGVDPEPFPAWHHRIKAELAGAQPGVLYLVAAGITGKKYCQLIKQAGGVAVDIGSVADIWTRAPTRQFWKAADAHVLT
jgi:hypothetical protein